MNIYNIPLIKNMSDTDNFNDGGDPLEGSGYFNGGCGCGVAGGSPSQDGDWLNSLSNLVGIKDMQEGYDKVDRYDSISYICFGLTKMLVIILIVLLLIGQEWSDVSVIIVTILASSTAIVWAIADGLHRYNPSSMANVSPV